tara:strand:- start:226 stop:1719 length:1494 start_codon:yes stop_codon:yes gene_type:complete
MSERWQSVKASIISHGGYHDSWQISAMVLVKGTALIYLIAFSSLWVQIQGLYGTEGILPIQDFMRQIQQVKLPFWELPSIFWISQEDWFLNLICACGILTSIFAMIGLLPILTMAVSWYLYLSVCLVGQDFIPFQWDTFLCEIGFLAIFLNPFKIYDFSKGKTSQLIIWLLWLLLFKLMFGSGVVKIASNDPSWLNLTALSFHYESQPIPNPGAWLLAQLPGWFHTTSVGFTFVVELLLPFGILLGRRPRYFVFLGFFLLQILIMFSGNYGFFNLVTTVLLFSLLDDAVFYSRFPTLRKKLQPHEPSDHSVLLWLRRCVATIIVGLYSFHFLVLPNLIPNQDYVLKDLYRLPKRLMIFNTYGLFAVMTTNRPEMIVEGSHDGQNWKPYIFQYKIQQTDQIPPIIWGHMPRLDWQMWFLQFRPCAQNRWIQGLVYRLLIDSQPVLDLLQENPFAGKAPRYIRVNQYNYRFTSWAEQAKSGNYWERSFTKPYCPIMSLK